MRGLLKLFGLRLGKVTTPNKRRERLEALFAQKPELRALTTPLIEAIEALEDQIKLTSARLSAMAAADPVASRLMSVPGVGPVCALTFISTIEDPERFNRGEDAGAFAGLAPRRSQSGEKDHKGHISKAGDPMLRSALYESANSLLSRVSGPARCATGALIWSGQRAPSAPAWPSPASSPSCSTGSGSRKPSSAGPDPANVTTEGQRHPGPDPGRDDPV